MMIPMDVTLLGIVTDVSEEQYWNAFDPRSSNVVIMIVRRNDNDDTYGCNTRRNGNGCQGGA